MLEKRTLVALVALVLVGGAVVWKVTRKQPHARALSQESTRTKPGAPVLRAADIDELAITEPDKPPVVLKKTGSEWRLVQPTEDKADQKNVEGALTTLEKMKWKDIVAESPSSYEKLQIKDDEVLKVVPKKSGSALATLLIGKGQNVRLEGDPKVWLVSDLNRYSLAREAKMWRDREIFRAERDKVDRIEVSFADGGKLAVKREAPASQPSSDPAKPQPPSGPDKWTLVEGQALVGGALDESMATTIFNGLVRLDAMEFADEVTTETAGLDKPRALVALVLADGTRRELAVGKEEGENVYVKRPDGPRIWSLRKTTVDGWVKPPIQWRDKQLAKIEAKDIKKLELVVQGKGSDKLVFEMGEGGWKATAPQDLAQDLDPVKVTGLASGFASLRGQAIADAPDAVAKLAKPAAVVTVGKTDGSSFTLTISEADAEGAKTYYAKVTGRPEIFTMADYNVTRFLKGPDDFKKSAAAKPAHP